jgi:hypothetical protein
MLTETKADVFESEPNNCGESGVKTIFASFPTGTFRGQLTYELFGTNDLNDYWSIESGTSGIITIDATSIGGCEINVISRNINYCVGTPTYLVSNLTSGTETFSYSSSDYVSIVVSRIVYSLSLSYIFNLSRSELPVELTTFTANVIENDVELNWETATEVKNYGFEVERKILSEGLLSEKQVQNDSWEKVAFVQGHGNSNSPKYYSFTDKSIQASGKYSYRLKQIDIDGTFEYSDEVEINIGSPNNFELVQNYPNPFNPTTIISYSIPSDARVTLAIYDALGKEVAVLDNGFRTAGNYSHTFDASNLSSGMYFYTIRTNDFVQTKKMLLLK